MGSPEIDNGPQHRPQGQNQARERPSVRVDAPVHPLQESTRATQLLVGLAERAPAVLPVGPLAFEVLHRMGEPVIGGTGANRHLEDGAARPFALGGRALGLAEAVPAGAGAIGVFQPAGSLGAVVWTDFSHSPSPHLGGVPRRRLGG